MNETDIDQKEDPGGISEKCSAITCTENGSDKMLKCSKCNQYIHYQCTRLPTYQLSLFLTKNYRNFQCEKCVVVPKSLQESHKETNFERFRTNEKILKETIKRLQAEMEEQEEKFNQAGNPDYDYNTNLERFIKNKLDLFKDSLLKEINDSNKQLKETLHTAVEKTKTYAETARSTNQEDAAIKVPKTTDDFRNIMREAREEENAELQEQNRRNKNVIIHGVIEENEGAYESDEQFMADLYYTLDLIQDPKSYNRIGKDRNRRRPIKLVFKNDIDKSSFMTSLYKLKNNTRFYGISITDDYTKKERETIKDFVNQAKTRNMQEDENSEFIWKARGNPKNGMFLKKVKKRKEQPNLLSWD